MNAKNAVSREVVLGGGGTRLLMEALLATVSVVLKKIVKPGSLLSFFHFYQGVNGCAQLYVLAMISSYQQLIMS